MGSSASVFRMSMSRVPWTRSLGLSAIDAFPLRTRRENTLLLLIVKRRNPIRQSAKLLDQGIVESLRGDLRSRIPGLAITGPPDSVGASWEPRSRDSRV